MITKEQIEKELIKHKGSVVKASKALGISQGSMDYKLLKFGLKTNYAKFIKKDRKLKLVFVSENMTLTHRVIGFFNVKGFNFKQVEFNNERAFLVEVETRKDLNLVKKLIKYDLENESFIIIENNKVYEINEGVVNFNKPAKLEKAESGQIFDKEENTYYRF